ncbi:anaerobic ribonucleoside-triphosphate reductase [Philodulcilactobacillus myokoensis]|uniref:Anaerobic ribonucleoside-triphosphate reductase n=2 Tax=Philodulcilactobacillus myokoensis TaxID=2929573 RepID=A0A9W6AZ52_9LACO|nr:anaerobic ribonucleoside-triphosphate reductase [Philodulcilactobacillus myokoensis]GLB46232.1 anaerobic ribonucleoside-triphosphate reductase [Philodulcilactobacillus myokoensis]
MATANSVNLNQLLKGKIVKRGGDYTNFYQYKIDFVLNRLNVPSDLQTEFKWQLFKNFQNKKLIPTTKIRTAFHQFFKAHHLTNDAKAYEQHFQDEQASFKKSASVPYRIAKLFNHDPRVVHENANKNSKVFNTQRDLQAGAACRAIGLQMLPDIVAKAHLRGDIHWHDLDYSPAMPETNCSLIDFKNMLNHGFKIGNAQVEPPKSINVAVAQVAQIIANVASLQYGGLSFNRADQVLAPFAKLNYQKHLKRAQKWVPKDKQHDYAKSETKKDIYDAMQSLEYEINTLYSSQGQTPFTTVNFGLGTNWFEKEIQKDMLKIRIKGLGKEHRTAIFPKLTFTIKRGLNLNPSDPNYDVKQLAIKCSAHRMYPDILMYDKIKEITGDFKTPMGCRSFLPKWVNKDGKAINDGRLNLGVVTVNLPRIALLAHGNQKLFWQIFDERMGTCHRALAYRIERTKQAKPEMAPLLYEYGAFGKRLKPNDSVDQLFNHERATVSLGYIGLYEVGTTFYGPNWEHNPKAHAFTVSIVKRMNEFCQKWCKESGYHYSLYSTPAESLTDTFCQDDIKKFGKVKDITDKEYYTNSFHYDVRKKPSPFQKLEFEEAYPHYASAGFIHYCEYPNLKQNPKALEAVWDWAYDHVGYLGTNTSIDQCFKCGFKGEFKATKLGFVCPQCGNHDPKYCDVVKRVCGYLGNPQARPMVHGRHLEIASRKKNMSTGMISNVANFERKRQSDTQRV